MRSSLQSGFTLIEAMVVVAIVGVLAGLAAVSMDGAIGRANQNSLDGRMYNMLSEARTLAMVKNAQVVVIVDMDDSTTPASHGGVYQILDPAREFSPAEMAGWSTGYTASSGLDPISANTGIFNGSPETASLRSSVRFANSGIAGVFKSPTAAQIGQFATSTMAAFLGNSPWPTPSSSGVTNAFSGTGCSFCNAAGLGYVLINPDGTSRLSNPDDITQTQTVGAKGYLMLADTRSNRVDRAIFFATPVGLVHSERAR